jgi:hypothetical protein
LCSISFVAFQGPDVSIYSKLSNSVEYRISTNGVGVRAIAIDSSGEYVGILDQQTGVTIHRLSAETGPLGKKILGSNQELRKNRVTTAELCRNLTGFGCQLSWSPVSHTLAVPSTNSILLYFKSITESSSWNEITLVSGDGDLQHSADSKAIINVVRFSPNGAYLASADTHGIILLWDVDKRNPMRRFHCVDNTTMEPVALFDLNWGRAPGDNYFVTMSATSWATVNPAVNIRLGPSPTATLTGSSLSLSAPASHSKQGVVESHSVHTEPHTTLTASDSQSNGAPSAQSTSNLKRVKKVGGGENRNRNDDDDDALFATIDAPKSESIRAIKAEVMGPEDDDLGDLEEDEQDPKASDAVFPFTSAAAEAGFSPYIHGTIEPSSTPFDEKRRRYMVWNQVGTITCREEDGGNKIEIKFADINGKNKNQSFSDHEGYCIAALGFEGACFANQPEDPSAGQATDMPVGEQNTRNGSTIYYHAFPGQSHMNGANETFSVTLAMGEIAECVAVGTGWVAVATSKMYLRVFSSTGLQIYVAWLRGMAVCTVGLGSQLAVIFNDGCSLPDGTPSLAVEYLTITHQGIKQEAVLKVPVTPGGSQLEWASFSDDGLLCVMDTEGILSALLRIAGWQWVPVLDVSAANRKVDHKFWPVAVKGSNLCYILLNGESKPLVYPQPVVSIKTFKPPIAETREGKDKGEAENERARSLLLDQYYCSHVAEQTANAVDPAEIEVLEPLLESRQLQLDKSLLKILNEALKVQRNAVASDVAMRINTPKCVDIAIQMCMSFNRPTIARQLTEILRIKQQMSMEFTDQQPTESNRKLMPPQQDTVKSQGFVATSRNGASATTPPQRRYDTAFGDDDDHADQLGQAEVTPEPVAVPQRGFGGSGGPVSLLGNSAVVTPAATGIFARKITENKAKQLQNALKSAGSDNERPIAPPINKFAQSSSPLSPETLSKKRSFPHEDLRNLKGSPSPKKPTLFVSKVYSLFLNFR